MIGPRSYIFASVCMALYGGIRSGAGESFGFSMYMAIVFMAFAVWKLIPAPQDEPAVKAEEGGP